MKTSFYSHGKLLITGEYAVLDGAKALAVPTKFGQSLTVSETDSDCLIWKSYDVDQHCWFSSKFALKSLTLISEKTLEGNILEQLLQLTQKINPSFLKHSKGVEVETHLEFSRKWGLGTSSTLLNNIAQWAKIDPYQLLKNRFSGSGYDIACAQSKQPIVYQIQKGVPKINPVSFDPSFKENLFFIYLNKKQNSQSAILEYHKKKTDKQKFTTQINRLSSQFITSSSLSEFQRLIHSHESLIGELTNQIPIQQRLFSGFSGAIKSLGAWGGDFILAAGNKDLTRNYFEAKGYKTILSFSEMI